MEKREILNLGPDAGIFCVLPVLYSKDSKGKIRQWVVGYFETPDGVFLRVRHGLVDGALVTSDRQVKAMNVGRSNERNPLQQAAFESEAAHKKQKDIGMRESIEELGETPVLPMLAKSYKDGKGKFPAYAQPKLNGVRCLSQRKGGGVALISRKNTRYTTQLMHLIKPLCEAFGGDVDWIVDGEIYKHGWSLQKISGLARGYKEGENEQLEYWIYDLADESLPFEDRMKSIEDTFKDNGNAKKTEHGHKLVKVPTVLIENEEQMKKLHDKFVELGFEGLILRQPKGAYKLGLYRSGDLEKYKAFIDHEFEIIGGRPAEGTQDGCVIFKVRGEAKDKDGSLTGKVVEFEVVPKGTLETRRQWMNDIDKLIGKQLTVRYFELSDDCIPQGNPVGECIRDYE